MAGGGFAREGEAALDAGVAGRGGVIGVVDGEAQGDDGAGLDGAGDDAGFRQERFVDAAVRRAGEGRRHVRDAAVAVLLGVGGDLPMPINRPYLL